MFTTFHLSYCGFQFDGRTDCDRRDAEMLLQKRNEGLKPGFDYLIQPLQNSWQLSGITPLGARACLAMAQGMKKIPNRLDVTMVISDNATSGLDFNTYLNKLVQWFSINKPKLNISEMLPIAGDRKWLFGSKNSRWCLWLSERTDPVQPFGGYQIELTWTARNENCLALWDYFVVAGKDSELEEYSREGFAAMTNSLLGPDFFGTGLPKGPYLKKEKKSSEDKDWYTYLSTVAGKIFSHYVNEPNADIDRDIAFLNKEIAARASKIFPSEI